MRGFPRLGIAGEVILTKAKHSMGLVCSGTYAYTGL